MLHDHRFSLLWIDNPSLVLLDELATLNEGKKNEKSNPPPILAAACGMLQPFFPELTPTKLLSMLKNAGKPEEIVERPLTRRQAATLLAISLPTLDRHIKSGILRASKIGPRSVRVDPTSVRELLAGEINNG